jgi:hypothetical protein
MDDGTDGWKKLHDVLYYIKDLMLAKTLALMLIM